MKEFKVGDKIRIYGFDKDDAGQVLTRVIDSYHPDNNGLLMTDAGEYVHPKQCRRLKPKRKAREVWVLFHESGREMWDSAPNANEIISIKNAGNSIARFKEVLK